MDQIYLWLQQNWSQLAITGGAGALLTFVWIQVKSKVIPALTNKAVTLFLKLISNLFASNIGEGDPLVEALPFVKDFQNLLTSFKANLVQENQNTQAMLVAQAELDLINLKQKISSPLYSAVERVPMEAAFNVLFAKFKQHLSPEVVRALEMLDKVTTQ